MAIRSSLFMFIFIGSLACKHAPTMDVNPIQPVPSFGGFDHFFEAFHQDSTYQMKHIRFPLEGLPEQEDTTTVLDDFRWTSAAWVLHSPINLQDTLFTRTFKTLDSALIFEIIQHRLSPMSMERRFSKSDGEWALIYYAPLRIPIKIDIN